MIAAKKKVSILLMRHSESTYNLMQSTWKAENNLPVYHPEDEPKRFIKDPNIIDAILSDEGIQQVRFWLEVPTNLVQLSVEY